jgi:hypothetical protein
MRFSNYSSYYLVGIPMSMTAIVGGAFFTLSKAKYAILPIIIESLKFLIIWACDSIPAQKYAAIHTMTIILSAMSSLFITYFAVGIEGIFVLTSIFDSFHMIFFILDFSHFAFYNIKCGEGLIIKDEECIERSPWISQAQEPKK